MVDQLAVRLSQGSELYARIRAASVEGIYIYGAGFVGSWAVSYLEELGIPVIGFIDSDLKKQGCIVSGKPILGLDDPGARSAKVILIGSRHAVPSIENVLANSSALIMSVDAFVVHQQGNEEIDRLEALFSHDQQSLKTVQAVLLSMLEGTTKPLSDVADNMPFFWEVWFF